MSCLIDGYANDVTRAKSVFLIGQFELMEMRSGNATVNQLRNKFVFIFSVQKSLSLQIGSCAEVQVTSAQQYLCYLQRLYRADYLNEVETAPKKVVD